MKNLIQSFEQNTRGDIIIVVLKKRNVRERTGFSGHGESLMNHMA
jgi:hypothetical protein